MTQSPYGPPNQQYEPVPTLDQFAHPVGPRRNAATWIAVAAAGVLAVVVAVVAIVRGTSEGADPAALTPQATVQAFMAAVDTADLDEATKYVCEDAPEDLLGDIGGPVPPDFSYEVGKGTQSGSTSEVPVELTIDYYTATIIFLLEEVNDEWLICDYDSLE